MALLVLTQFFPGTATKLFTGVFELGGRVGQMVAAVITDAVFGALERAGCRA